MLSYRPLQSAAATPERLDLAWTTCSAPACSRDVRLDVQGRPDRPRVENPIINQVLFEGNSASAKRSCARRSACVRAASSRLARVQQTCSGSSSSTAARAAIGPRTCRPDRRAAAAPRRPGVRDQRGPDHRRRTHQLPRNSEFSDRELRGVWLTDDSRWYRFFSTTTTYEPRRLEYEPREAARALTHRGYYDFRVISAVASWPRASDFK